MAQEFLQESAIKITFQNGVKENGEPLLVTKSLYNLKETATSDAIMQVVESLASLVSYPLYSVERNNSFDVTQ